jgi:hypothetical protein
MPTGVYERSDKYLQSLRERMKQLHKLPKSQKQIDHIKSLSKRPMTEKQKKNIEKAWASPKILEVRRENIKVAVAAAATKPRTEKQIENAKRLATLPRSSKQLETSFRHLQMTRSCEKRKLAAVKYNQSPEGRRQRRIGTLRQIKKQKGENGQILPVYNHRACDFFRVLNLHLSGLGYPTGRYATDGGEHHIECLGYFLDYFNPGLKLIIEWDEPGHYDRHGNLRERDILRQNEIQGLYPDFKFIRIEESRIPDGENPEQLLCFFTEKHGLVTQWPIKL